MDVLPPLSNQPVVQTSPILEEAAATNGSTPSTETVMKAFDGQIQQTNEEYVNYLKTMISSLLDNQMTLTSALDETRETCTQLSLVSVYYQRFAKYFF